MDHSGGPAERMSATGREQSDGGAGPLAPRSAAMPDEQGSGMRLRRSLITTPCNVASKLEKARSFQADVLMLDLEDGVPEGDESKLLARQQLVDAMQSREDFTARELAIRVNGPRSPWFLDDLETACRLGVPTVVLPMVEDADDVVLAERCAERFGAAPSLGFVLLVETPAAVLNLPEMVRASPRINGLIAGGLDYAMCIHSLSILPVGRLPAAARADDDLIYMRQRVLAVARAGGLSVLDAMRPRGVSDLDAFRADAEYSRWLGFDGVDFFHPAFIDVANDVFTPSGEELAWARKVLDVPQQAGNEGRPASRIVDGQIILPQHVEIARRLTTLADVIAAV